MASFGVIVCVYISSVKISLDFYLRIDYLYGSVQALKVTVRYDEIPHRPRIRVRISSFSVSAAGVAFRWTCCHLYGVLFT